MAAPSEIESPGAYLKNVVVPDDPMLMGGQVDAALNTGAHAARNTREQKQFEMNLGAVAVSLGLLCILLWTFK